MVKFINDRCVGFVEVVVVNKYIFGKVLLGCVFVIVGSVKNISVVIFVGGVLGEWWFVRGVYFVVENIGDGVVGFLFRKIGLEDGSDVWVIILFVDENGIGGVDDYNGVVVLVGNVFD